MADENVMTLKVKGHVKVELFDAKTGKLNEMKEGENIVTRYGALKFKALMHQILSFGVPNNDSATGVNYNFNSSPYAMLFKALFITDNEDTPAVEDDVIKGTMTGYCTVSDVTTVDVERGLYSRGESISTPTKIKMVFDFASGKGNGTFRSLWLSDIKYYQYLNVKNAYNLLGENPNIVFSDRVVKLSYVVDGGDYYYGVGFTSSSLVYKISKTDWSIVETITLPRACNYAYAGVFAYYNEHIYYRVSGTLYKYSLVSRTEVATIILSGLTSCNDGIAVLGDYLYYAYNTLIYRVNLITFTYDTSKAHGGKASNQAVQIIDNKICVINLAETDYCEFDWSTGVLGTSKFKIKNSATDVLTTGVYSSAFNLRPYTNYGDSAFFLNNELYLVVMQSYSYHSSSIGTDYIYTVIKADMTRLPADALTHKLLDAPVTKTSAQTMKITYEINIA